MHVRWYLLIILAWFIPVVDLSVERNHIMNQVTPVLNKYCLQKKLTFRVRQSFYLWYKKLFTQSGNSRIKINLIKITYLKIFKNERHLLWILVIPPLFEWSDWEFGALNCFLILVYRHEVGGAGRGFCGPHHGGDCPGRSKDSKGGLQGAVLSGLF